MLILGIETSCDETGAAVVEDGLHILGNVVASQESVHLKYGGVVPELACRAHIESIIPVISQALETAGVGLRDLSAISVATRPGLIGALLIGLTAAKTLAWVLGVPIVPIDHLQAHIYACNFGENPVEYPVVALLASGGHTSLFLCRDVTEYELLGSTLDDAAGEAFDKVAAILGLGYSGGPLIDREGRKGDPNALSFPRTYLGKDSLDFSFSGLKTAVLYHVRGQDARGDSGELTPQERADVCAAFQEAVVDVLVAKTIAAATRCKVEGVALGGGVAANSRLRERLGAECGARGWKLYMPPMEHCTDNAAMVAGLAYHKVENADRDGGLYVDAFPSGCRYEQTAT